MRITSVCCSRYFNLVTLDFFGTVGRLRSDVGYQYTKIAENFGVHVKHDVLSRNYKEVWVEMNKMYPIYGVQSFGWKKWWETLIDKTFRKSTAVELDNEAIDKISERLFEIFKKEETWELCDGALGFIKHMHDRGIPLVILSNNDPRLEDLLLKLQIRNYFRFVVNSYDVGVQKPDIAIFQVVEEMLKQCDDLAHIRKNEILHIGDSPELDYISAIKAGWSSFLIHDDEDAVIEQYPSISKSCIFKNLGEVEQQLLCKLS